MNYQKIIFSLGSNVGDREKLIEKAKEKLIENLLLSEVKTSEIIETDAILLPNSPKEWSMKYMNSAMSGMVNLDNFSLQKILKVTQKIEADLGRIYRGKWSPREIDIDILYIGEMFVNEENLKIPHPEIKNRKFLLKLIEDLY